MSSDTAAPVLVPLHPDLFRADEREVVTTARLSVTAFTYPSGVAALRVSAGRVEAVLLPLRGQQVWRYAVDGIDQTMRTHFGQPTASTDFGQTYGPFLLHCGLTGIGHPQPEDTHAHHGELPNIAYERAWLEVCTGTEADSVTLVGTTRIRSTHAIDLEFTPRLTISTDSTALDVHPTVTNLRMKPYEYSYLCHVNWRFEPATLHQWAPMDADHFRFHPTDGATPETAAYIEAITADPASSNTIDLETPLDPEYCALVTPVADEDGWTEFLMRRADGTVPSVRFRTDHLPYAVRWLSNTGDEQAAGIALPSTAHHLGRAGARAEDMLVTLEPGQTHDFHVVVDVLEGEQGAARVAQADAHSLQD
ncbi:DUF4432 family protein [Schaalia sp. 19OD2882]|uniref:DUF4432 family protein n=1 Tax=Schaalia sp. 19OD2882 TaxID=2794089 RepID=UPI001C1EE400|nr:DUF4432 family protein [Schaalia sp. 19OD2882]QWW18986.1 DUF4432 family protein [Schaalia sp. 19OD2882]